MNQALSDFFIRLATDAKLLRAFNTGNNEQALKVNRVDLLANYGISDTKIIVEISERALADKFAEALVAQHPQWRGVENSVGNTNNTNNSITHIIAH
jgi:hypothetical protein